MTKDKSCHVAVTVTVSGPGGCINYELEILRRALIAAGCSVTVENDHPYEPGEEDKALLIIEAQQLAGRIPQSKVNIVANHLPWGG